MTKVFMTRDKQLDMCVGLNLRTIRTSRGCSRKDLSRLLNRTTQQISKYELGKNRIGAGQLYILSEFFDISIQQFFAKIDVHLNTLLQN